MQEREGSRIRDRKGKLNNHKESAVQGVKQKRQHVHNEVTIAIHMEKKGKGEKGVRGSTLLKKTCPTNTRGRRETEMRERSHIEKKEAAKGKKVSLWPKQKKHRGLTEREGMALGLEKGTGLGGQFYHQ